MWYFLFGNFQFNAAQRIHSFNQSLKANRHIVGNIQIRIHINHADCLCRSSLGISCITFIIAVISQIQIRITINGNQLHLMGICINGTDHDRVTAVAFSKASIPCIHAEQGYLIYSG